MVFLYFGSTMTQTRQLAAIMFTDIAGYTALMEEDEERALELLRKNRTLQGSIIKKYHGKWLKEIGDGVLASFKTISDAVYAAGAIQSACKLEPDLKLRIAIHVGEVIVEENDVFGSGVNVASRIEPLAPVGGILVTDSVYKNIHNKKKISANLVEEKYLRGVKEPVKIYQVEVEEPSQAVQPTPADRPESKTTSFKLSGKTWIFGVFVLGLLGMIYLWLHDNGNQGNRQSVENRDSIRIVDKSIAVIPFKDISPSGDQQWFSDGIMDAVLSNLSKISDLRVISRTSMERYRDAAVSISQIAEETNANYLLEGSAQRIDDKVRVIVQLINAQADEHVWSEIYFRDTIKVFDVQSEIAKQIAQELSAELSPTEETEIDQIPTENLAAYHVYMKGLQYENSYSSRRDKRDLDLAIHFYKLAISEDPDFFMPKVRLGWTYLYRVNELGEQIHLYDSAQAMAEQLMERHSNYSEVLSLLGNIYWVKGINPTGLRDNLIKAVRLNPSDPLALFQLARYFSLQETRHDLALILGERLTKIDQTNPQFFQNQWVSRVVLGYFAEGEELLNTALKVQPDFNLALTALGMHHLVYNNDADRSIEFLGRALAINPDNLNNNHQIAQTFSWTGDFQQSEQYFLKVKEVVEQENYTITRATPWFPHRYAYVLWNLDRKEEARKYFQEEIDRDLQFLSDSTQSFGLGFYVFYDLAGVHAFLGQQEEALEWLVKLMEHDVLGIANAPSYILMDPLFDNLEGEPRFNNYLETFEQKVERQRRHYQELKDLSFAEFLKRIEEPLPK